MTKYLKTKEGSIEDLAKQMQNKVLESDYQDKFKKALDKEGKPLGQMTGAEKKSFFNKIDKMHKGKDENAMSVADVDRLKKQGMKKESLGKEDKPVIKKVVDKLKGASQAHAGQAKDLEKAMKTESINETHTTQTAKANAQQRAAGGEKSPISLMKNKSIDEITANNGKTFAQMRAEIDESKDSEQTYPSKETKIKGPNPADKGEKEHQTGEDTRDPKKKAMSGGIATTPEMNPKVDYKY